MPFPFPSNVSQSQTLALTALATAITTTSLILTFQSLRREHRNERLKREVGEDVDEWEKSLDGRGVATPEERAERFARGSSTPGGKKREWEKGEFDEGLIREQVGCAHQRSLPVPSGRRADNSSHGITTFWAKKRWRKFETATSS